MKRPLSLWICCLLFFACIGEDFVDDYVDPNLRITNAIISIREGLNYQFKALFFDESGREVNNPTLKWSAIPPTAVVTCAFKFFVNTFKSSSPERENCEVMAGITPFHSNVGCVYFIDLNLFN